MALHHGRAPRAELTHDLHLLEVLEAAHHAAQEGRAISIVSRFRELDLQLETLEARADRHHLHDHTRPADEQ